MPLRKPVFTAQTLHQQLRDEIYRRLRNHELRPGDQLPSEIAMAEEFGISVGTVRKVLDDLVANHVVERRKGRGTYVTAGNRELVEWRFYRLQHPNNRVPSPGPASTVVRRPTGHEMAALKIGPDTDVLHIVRVRSIDGTPVILEAITVPEEYVPGLQSIETYPIFMLSYYYDQYGVIIQRSEENIKAVAADEVLAAKLEVEAGAPIMHLERLLFDSTDRPFELRARHCTEAVGYYKSQIG